MQITSRLVRTSARRLGAALVLAACAASAHAAAVVGYVDAAGWAAGVKGSIQGWSAGAPPALPGMVNDFRPWDVFHPVTPTPIVAGRYQVQADSVVCATSWGAPGLGCLTYTAFSFATPITAFGIDLDVLPGGLGDGVSFLVSFLDGTKLEIGEYVHDDGVVAGTSHGFFGFTSDTAIGLISLITNSPPPPLLNHEAASVNRFQYVYRQDDSGGGGSSVPEPATWALALLALTALRTVARR